MLTESEKKKIRRRRNIDKQKELRDKISLGLIPPPEDRVTLSSFMRTLGNEAIEDPTAVEAKVRAQMEKRRLAHQMHNEAQKLTPAQRKDKHRRKLQEDTTGEVHVSVFKIKNLENNSHRFKVIVNAEQYNLTGLLILFESCNLVFVEGGLW
jgi:U4/U6 small nuclear ribonucleoprotein PRP3